MQKKSTGFIVGMGIGLAVGAAGYGAAQMAVKNNKPFVKTAGKAIKSVGEFALSISRFMR